MLYQSIDSYTPGLKMNKDGNIILDLAQLKKPFFTDFCGKLAEQNQIQKEAFTNGFMDTLISPEDLNLKLKAVILPFDCFIRPYCPTGQWSESLQSVTPYLYLKKKYESFMTIGLKVNLADQSQIKKLKELSLLKKIKLFSFDINESQMLKDLPIMRQYVKEFFKVDKKIHFHIRLNLETVYGLKVLKKQLISYEYPIEFCMLQTNLINIVERHFGLNFSQNWQEIAFKYAKTIGKYIPSAIGCLLESHSYQNEDQDSNLKRIFLCLNLINSRNQRQQRIYKSYHNTGLGTIQPILVKLLEGYTPDIYGHSKIKGDWSIYLSKMYDIVIGKYQHEQKTEIFDYGPIQDK